MSTYNTFDVADVDIEVNQIFNRQPPESTLGLKDNIHMIMDNLDSIMDERIHDPDPLRQNHRRV